MVISDKNKRLLYISPCREGKVHDDKLLQQEFPPNKDWFAKFQVTVDLGYFGMASEYRCKGIQIPHKKPRNQELNATQKQVNRKLAAERVPVEHSLGGLKRYRILSDRLRLHTVDLYHFILGVCAGLWNFYLSN
jgi:hypothetical protein